MPLSEYSAALFGPNGTLNAILLSSLEVKDHQASQGHLRKDTIMGGYVSITFPKIAQYTLRGASSKGRYSSLHSVYGGKGNVWIFICDQASSWADNEDYFSEVFKSGNISDTTEILWVVGVEQESEESRQWQPSDNEVQEYIGEAGHQARGSDGGAIPGIQLSDTNPKVSDVRDALREIALRLNQEVKASKMRKWSRVSTPSRKSTETPTIEEMTGSDTASRCSVVSVGLGLFVLAAGNAATFAFAPAEIVEIAFPWLAPAVSIALVVAVLLACWYRAHQQAKQLELDMMDGDSLTKNCSPD